MNDAINTKNTILIHFHDWLGGSLEVDCFCYLSKLIKMDEDALKVYLLEYELARENTQICYFHCNKKLFLQGENRSYDVCE